MAEIFTKYYQVLEYCGSRFHGWQRQPGLRTVQGEVERAVAVTLHGRAVSVLASGRTDSGVHARAQAVEVMLPENVDISRVCHSLSSLLKNEVAVRGARRVPEDFHILNDATRKQYTYTIYTGIMPPVLDYGQVWHLNAPLDIDAMTEAAAEFVGKHNFLSFCGSGSFSTTFEREIFESVLSLDGPYLRYRVVGGGFLKQMVRNMVGTLVDIGRGRLKTSVEQILKARNRRVAGVTAQPFGLCMDWVEHKISDETVRSDKVIFSRS